MEIKEITQNKKAYLSLLLLADEQESMIDKYLTKGQMYVLFEKDIPVAECVVLAHDNELEIMNLATDPHFQKQGYAKKLVSFIESWGLKFLIERRISLQTIMIILFLKMDIN